MTAGGPDCVLGAHAARCEAVGHSPSQPVTSAITHVAVFLPLCTSHQLRDGDTEGDTGRLSGLLDPVAGG